MKKEKSFFCGAEISYPAGPLFQAIKQNFLRTADFYDDLGEQKQHFTNLLAYASLKPMDEFSSRELKAALLSLPQEGLENMAQAISDVLDSVGEQREE